MYCVVIWSYLKLFFKFIFYIKFNLITFLAMTYFFRGKISKPHVKNQKIICSYIWKKTENLFWFHSCILYMESSKDFFLEIVTNKNIFWLMSMCTNVDAFLLRWKICMATQLFRIKIFVLFMATPLFRVKMLYYSWQPNC